MLIGGGRILKDKVQSTSSGLLFDDPFGVLPLPPGLVPLPIQNGFSEEFTEVLPKFGLTYDLTDNQTVGFTYTEGYRNGFVELNLNTGAFNNVKPEHLKSYEVSYRSTWANDTVSFNANTFYYDYKDQQVGFEEELFGFLPYPVSVILNADSSQAYGAEFEARWRPLPPLQLYGSLGLMRTEFESFDSSKGNFTGKEFPEAPAYTIASGGMWKDPSGWFAGANVRYTDGYYSGGDLGNTSLRFIDSYAIVDARIGWEWEQYTLTIFAKNLFNEEYLTSINAFTPPNLPNRATVGDEQLFGVTLRGEF